MPGNSSNRVRNAKPAGGKSTPSTNIAIVVKNDKSSKMKNKGQAKARPPNDVTSLDATGPVPFQYPSSYFKNRVLQPSWLVQTPYGVGTVIECRAYEQGETDDERDADENDDEETAFDLSKKTTGEYKYFIRLTCNSDSISPFSRLVTFDNYPSVDPQIGSEVVLTCFDRSQNKTLQRGRVVNLRPHLRQAVVRLVSWRLMRVTASSTATAAKLSKSIKRRTVLTDKQPPEKRHYPTVSFVTCYLGYESIQVVNPKPVEAMSAYETLLYVYERQHLAYEQYVARQYATCCDLYESAITAIRSLLFEKYMAEILNVRGNLILTQIRCCNQAAVCCLHMENFQGVIGHAMSALKMLRALEKKRDVSDDAGSNASSASGKSSVYESGTDRQEMRQFDRLCGEVRVFGVLRIKSMQLLTLALVKFSQWEHAKEICLQAHKIVIKYTTQAPPNTSKLRRSAFRDYLSRKAQLLHIDKSLLRLYARIEQRRGSRKKPTDRSIVIIDHDSSDDGDDVSTLDDVDAEWLDDDEERDMQKDWHPMAVVVGQLPEHGGFLLMPSPRRDDADSVVTDASCDLSCSRASHLDVGTKMPAVVKEDEDSNLTLSKNAFDIVTGSASYRTPVEAATVPIETVPSTTTSDSDGSFYEGAAKVSPNVMSKGASDRASDSKDPVGPHVAKKPLDETRLPAGLSQRGASWDELDLDTCLADQPILIPDDMERRSRSAVLIQASFRGASARRALWELNMKYTIAATTIQALRRWVSTHRAYQSRILGRESAATKIQVAQRAHAHRSRYHRERNAIIICQARARGFVAQRRFQRVRSATIHATLVLQAWRRGIIQRQDYRRDRNAIFLCQACARRILAERHVQRVRSATIHASLVLQAWLRGVVQSREYRRDRNAIVLCQARARGLLAQRRSHQVKRATLDACVKVQAWRKGMVQRKDFLLQRQAAVAIQSFFRFTSARVFAKCRRVEMENASVRLSSWYRGEAKRREVEHFKTAANAASKQMQAMYRCRCRRRMYQRQQKAVIILQSHVRSLRAQKQLERMRLLILSSVTLIQSLYRRYHSQQNYRRILQSVLLIQSHARSLVAQRQLERTRLVILSSVTLIQSLSRSYRAQRRHRRILQSVLMIQSFVRLILARLEVSRLKAISAKEAHQNIVFTAPVVGDPSQVLFKESAEASSAETPPPIRSSNRTVEGVSSRRDKGRLAIAAKDPATQDPASIESVALSTLGNAESDGKDDFHETASHASDASEVGTLNSARYSTVSAPVRFSSRTKKSGAAARKAFINPETLRQLKARTNQPSLAAVPASPETPSTSSQLSSPGMTTEGGGEDDASVLSEDASQITSASAYFDAASQHSEGEVSDAGDSLHSARSRASAMSGYSRYSVVSAPAFVRSEMGNVRDRHGNVTAARRVFVDSATLKKLQKRSRPNGSSNRRKPFIAPHLMDELMEGASMTSMREPGGFETVYEEPPDDNWRDEIKVFAPKTAKKKKASAAGKVASTSTSCKGMEDTENAFSSGASVGGASVGATSVGGSSVNRRVSFARDVVFSEDFTAGRADRLDDDGGDGARDGSSLNYEDDQRPRTRRKAWYQTREFRAGVGTLVASGASIGTLIASKLMKNR